MAVYTKSAEVFFTPAQVALYMNGYLLEDACFIRYEVVDNWTPHYGYNDINHRTVSRGQTIVSGELGIVFRYEGYLTRVIDVAQQIRSSYNAESVAALRQGSSRSISDDLIQSEAAAVLDFLDSAADTDQKAFEKASAFLKDRFWGKGESTKDTPEPNPYNSLDSAHTISEQLAAANYYRPSTRKEMTLNLRIVHGREENIAQPNYAREIKGVQFRGQSYEADIRVPDGSSVVTEVYPFMAKDVGPISFSVNA